jgi:thiamine-monophosphate kinase
MVQRKTAGEDSARRKLRKGRAREFGEFAFLNRVRSNVQTTAAKTDPALSTGIGDDGAVLKQKTGLDTVITTDMLVEDIDFSLDYTAPRLLGYKSLAVSLSDIAAMGAQPRWALLTLGVPEAKWDRRFLDQFYDGFYELAAKHGVVLVGGDVSRTTSGLVIDSIMVGETARGRAILRSGAAPGDLIFVTGELGGANAGLQLLASGARLPNRALRAANPGTREMLMLRHLRPEPRTNWGIHLGKERLASAAIDLSDGLSSDLVHLCAESGVGAELDESLIPIDRSISSSDQRTSDALNMALNGGEDFELLFTVSPRKAAKLPKSIDGIAATCIGRITPGAERVRLLARDGTARPLAPGGYQHFR